MATKKEKILIQLGFMTDKQVGKAVGAEFVSRRRNLDATVATFFYSRNNIEETRQLVENAVVVTHSHGVRIIDTSMKPKALIIVGGPEPQNFVRLLFAATAGAARSIVDQVRSRGEKHYIFFIQSVKAALLHPIQHIKDGLEVSRFSTIKKIEELLDVMNNSTITVVVMSNDKLFVRDQADLRKIEDLGVRLVVLNGEHNDLYEKPNRTVAKLYAEIFQVNE